MTILEHERLTYRIDKRDVIASVDEAWTWQEVEVAVEWLGLFGGGPAPSLTHGMCEDCYARVMAADGL